MPKPTNTLISPSPTPEVASQPDPVIRQAKRDIDAGLVDTDMRQTPGLDAERRKQLVPTPTVPSDGHATSTPGRKPTSQPSAPTRRVRGAAPAALPHPTHPPRRSK